MRATHTLEPESPAHIPYRPDIDGLRAVAVLAILWFHSGLPGTPGGYTGVDVFFVISGYLITSIILRDSAEGSFSFASFYERRFRRIAPALLTVTAATMAAGYLLLLPDDLDRLSKSAAAAVAMVPNIHFWLTLNYFAPPHWIAPMLHSWSLGVEEQFYLLFPATLILARRFWKMRPAITLLAAGSLALCILSTPTMPAASFYLLPTRGWELMVGALLAVGIGVPERFREAGAAAGVTLILAGCLLLSADDLFPGWRALLPAIGAALVIAGGTRSTVARALSFGPCVYIGRVSYSLYLWHWPILVFMRHWRTEQALPPLWALGGMCLALALAAASYHWIEQPARRRSVPFRTVLISCLGGAAVILAAAGAAIAGGGLPARFPKEVIDLAAQRTAYAPLAHACLQLGIEKSIRHCRFGPAGPPEILLWGDSHAAAISEAVAIAIDRPGLLIATGGCEPMLHPVAGLTEPGCAATNAAVLRLAVAHRGMRIVVLSGYWAWAEREGGPAMWASVQRMIDRLNAAGKTVIVVAGVPEPGVDVPWANAIRMATAQPPLRISCPSPHIPLHGILLVDVSAGFCREPASLLFTDSNHPSRYAGLKIIAPAIRGSARWVS
jgi:peptidoglycan/LPS O-acetylase OafA/YrhL